LIYWNIQQGNILTFWRSDPNPFDMVYYQAF
jgi:hypothetical protein